MRSKIRSRATMTSAMRRDCDVRLLRVPTQNDSSESLGYGRTRLPLGNHIMSVWYFQTINLIKRNGVVSVVVRRIAPPIYFCAIPMLTTMYYL